MARMRSVLALMQATLTLSVGAQAPVSSARIVLQPTGPLVFGDDLTVGMSGLTPGLEYQLVMEMINEWGISYRSSNIYAAGASGRIDLGQAAPLRGSYVGADPQGIFWSATRQGALPTIGPLDTPSDSLRVAIMLRQAGRTLDSAKVVLWLLRPGSRVQEIRDGGVTAALYEPAGDGPHPLVVVIGGSGGGMTWQRQTAAVLASKGYSALALAYFGVEGLATSLSSIPLEYFQTAVTVARSRGRIAPRPAAVIGWSRGAEAALLIAATYPQTFSAVVAFAPSHVHFMGQRPPDFAPIPSWTLAGKPISYVPTQEIRAFRRTDNQAERHLRYLTIHADSARAATIPVERISGPVLLFAGGADPIWPAALMAELLTQRLAEKGFGHSAQRFVYDSAGHAFARPGYSSTVPVALSNGGEPRANAHAQRDSWQRLLEFLAAWRRQ